MNRGNSHPQKVGKKRQIMTKNAYKWFSAAALAIVMTGAVAGCQAASGPRSGRDRPPAGCRTCHRRTDPPQADPEAEVGLTRFQGLVRHPAWRDPIKKPNRSRFGFFFSCAAPRG